MKKQLLGTTALVTAGLITAGTAEAQQAAAKGQIQLQLGGYMQQWIGTSNNKALAENAIGINPIRFSQQSDAEIYFRGSTTLDNGIQFGVMIEREVVGSPGNVTDEQFLYVESKFGRVILGMEDAPAFMMQYTAPDVGIGLSYGSQWQWVPAPAVATTNGSTGFTGGFDGPGNATRIRMEDDDSNKIIYYTPRIEGFQFGIAYIPSAQQDGILGLSTATGATIDTKSTTYYNGWSMGANFVRKLDKIDVALALGYQKWGDTPREGGVPSGTTANAPDPWAYSVGLNLGYAGFTLGGSYVEIKNLRVSDTTVSVSNGGKSWDVGLQYDWGPNAVSVGYFTSSVDGDVAQRGHDVSRKYQVSGRHKFSAGIEARASVFRQIWTGEDNSDPNDDNAGWGIVSGIVVNF